MRTRARSAACAVALVTGWCVFASAAPGRDDIPALEAQVAAAPADTDARYALARAYARAGRPADAGREYDVLLAENAHDADWLLGKAQAVVALGRPREALPLLARARKLAPQYEDVWHAEARALEASADEGAALGLLDAAEKQFPGSTWPAERRARLAEARLLRRGARLSAGAAYEDLSGDNDPWRSANVALTWPLGAATHLATALALERRYGRQDEQISAAIAKRLPARWSLDAGGAFTPNAELLPKHDLHVEVGRPLGRASSAALRYRRSHFDTVDVNALSLTGEHALRDFRIAYTLTGTRPTDIDVTFGHALRAARDYGTGSSITALIARGDEAETVSPGRVLVTRVTTLAVYGIHWRSAAWGCSWSASWTEQGDLYERLGVRLGVEHRF
jgi:YaiO family outer membrane protein